MATDKNQLGELKKTGDGADAAAKRVIVANAGAIPEMTYMAAGLARAGLLQKLIIPIGSARGEMPASLEWLPQAVRRTISRELRRRALPKILAPSLVSHAGTILEIASVAFGRLPALESLSLRCLLWRNTVLEAEVMRQLGHHKGAVILAYTAALHALKRARSLGVQSYLEFPVAHHHFTEAMRNEEARRVPDFAATLPQPMSEKTQHRLDLELKLSDHVFVLSSFQKRTLVEQGVDESKLILTPLGVDLQLFQPAAREEDGTFRVLFSGRVSQLKGTSYLLTAFQRLAIPRSELLFVGPTLGSGVRWWQRPNVRWMPAVPRWQLPEYYAWADVYVLPSLTEGFAQTALEAMACGLPVIVSENTFAGDIITDGVDGFIVPIRDADAIADRLSYLNDHPDERLRMGLAARRCAEDFSWGHYEERIVQIVSSGGGAAE